jgi:hypothetical protein
MPLQTLVVLLGKPMKLNALIVKIIGALLPSGQRLYNFVNIAIPEFHLFSRHPNYS